MCFPLRSLKSDRAIPEPDSEEKSRGTKAAMLWTARQGSAHLLAVRPRWSPPLTVGLSGPALFDLWSKSAAIRPDLHPRVLDANSPLGLSSGWLRPLVRSGIRPGPEGYLVRLRPRSAIAPWTRHRSTRLTAPWEPQRARVMIGNWRRAFSNLSRPSSSPMAP